MNIFVTGATGFIGGALVARLLRDGHEVSAWVRSPASANLERNVRLVPTRDDARLTDALRDADAVVHLAGAPVVGKRWTASYRETIRASRVDLTRRLVDAIGALPENARPGVLVSASAVGYYGDVGVVDESAPAGDDFLATVCRDWERAAGRAQKLGLRVVTPRIGVVLGAEGGALGTMLPAFELGVGGKLGSGRQGMSWVHQLDVVEMLVTAVDDERYEGAFNATAPETTTNAVFTETLGDVLGKPTAIPVPAPALKLVFGGGAAAVLTGQQARPEQLAAWGFRHRFPTLKGALRDILLPDDVGIGPASDTPDSAYLDKRGATYLLRARVKLQQPIDEVFPFFSQAENLGLLTPPNMSFQILGQNPDTMRDGTLIDYRIQLGPLPLRWRTRIERWLPGERFVDSQLKGPYRSWWHEHIFEAEGDATWMEDRVYYRPPLGLLGRIAHGLFIRRQLERIFGYRRQAVRFRFGLAEHVGAG